MNVLVAMSGGVDSAVAAYLIAQKHNAIGVTMRLHTEDETSRGENSCCSEQDIRDAKKICDTLGIPHTVCDFAEQFRAHVIADFIDATYRMVAVLAFLSIISTISVDFSEETMINHKKSCRIEL